MMSGTLLWIAALVVAAALALGTANVGRAAIEQSQAGSAADAAALAGAAAGFEAAVRATDLNGANLVSFSQEDNVFRVVVQVGGSTGEAFAERVFVPIGPGHPT